MNVKKKICISIIGIIAISSIVFSFTAFAKQITIKYTWENSSAGVITDVLSVGSNGKIRGEAKFNKGGVFGADSAESIIILGTNLSSRSLITEMRQDGNLYMYNSNESTSCKVTGELWKKTLATHHGIYGYANGDSNGFYIDGNCKY